MEKCPSPTLQWSISHFSCCYKPSPLQAYWWRWCHTHLLQLSCLFTVCVRECPIPTLQSSGALPSLLCVFCFFSAVCLLFSFFFRVVVSLSRGLCCFIPGVAVVVPCAAYLLTSWSVSPKQARSWASGILGALLFSPFNMELGCYARAEGVEVSEFCLLLVVFLARCISSISPRV
jgi:hypothetical protein